MLRYLESNSSKSTQKRKPTSSFLNLSLFSGSAPARSPRNFDAGGGVGLGIAVALASGEDVGGGAVVRATKPIATKRARTREEMERSESYTCVISHVGGKKVKKRVYFGDGSDEFDDEFVETPKSAEAQLAAEYPIADFLRNCYLCEKNLDGLDVYMYRGERAFCSPECREQHLLTDDFWENCGSEATKSYECPESPCSGLCSAAGVVAA